MTVISAKKSSRTRSPANNVTTLLPVFVALIVGTLCLRMFIFQQQQPPAKPVQNPKVVLVVEEEEGSASSTAKRRPSAQPQQQDGGPPIRLAINPSGTMAIDILSIEHVPEKSAIVVTLNPRGRCTEPYLRGRLSGPALILLEWSRSASSAETTDADASDVADTEAGIQHIGYYGRIPISGMYFVEIIAITCQDFSHSFDFDFRHTCLEDPANNRLTETNAHIYIDSNNSPQRRNNPHNQHQQPTMGHWVHQSVDEQGATARNNNDYSPVYTRYQPRGCLRINDPSHEHYNEPPKHCIEPTNWDRFEPYTKFQYYNNDDRANNIPPPSAEEIYAPQATTICLVGGSHSRTLRASMQNYHNITLVTNNIQIEWINAKFPRNVPNATIVSQIKDKCQKVIVAVGQWPASFSGNAPTLFEQYRLEMSKLFGRLQVHAPTTQIWARNIHENPLTERIANYCPPKDWRSPPVLEGYNTIIRQLALASNGGKVRFVDTSFIVTPLWDASTDWGHVCEQASHVEALYLIAVVMGLVQHNTTTQ